MKRMITILMMLALISSMCFTAGAATNRITEISITGVPDAAIGETASTASIRVPENAGYSITSAIWYDYSDYEEFSEKFEKGKQYSVDVTIQIQDGYSLTSGTVVTINGMETEDFFYYDGELYVYKEFSFAETISSVSLKGVTAPRAGEKPSLNSLQVASGAHYSVSEAYWVDYADGEALSSNDTFQKGHRYELNVLLISDEGYLFDEMVPLYINDEFYETIYSGGDSLYFYDIYSLCEEISSVTVTGVPEAAFGNLISTASVSVPAGAPYTIDTVEWYDASTFDSVSGKFEKGKRYIFCLDLIPKDGYDFTAQTTLTINGAEVPFLYIGQDWLSISYEYSFCEVIDRVDLPAFPEITLGDTASASTLEDPAGTNYSIESYWTCLDFDRSFTLFEGDFEDGQVYLYNYELYPAEGYEFAKDVKVTVGGKEIDSLSLYTGSSSISVSEVYNFGVKEIRSVDLTLEAPEMGAYTSTASVPAEAEYQVTYQEWYVGTTGDYNQAVSFSGFFEEGKYYWADLVVSAKRGTIFAEDVAITVNGMVPDELYFDPVSGGICVSFGQLTEKEADTSAVTAILQLLIGLDAEAVDHNGDGDITIADAVELLRELSA
ncbi:MAG: hypothetical protein IJ043_02510 [Clostridia bacterium]|nr:hypothetical protein [Clostridia bacterium]